MFHTCILPAAGEPLDFDRASHLMDRELLQHAIEALERERREAPRSGARYDAQRVWDDYCERHRERYGEPFGPNVNPAWEYTPTPIPSDSELGRELARRPLWDVRPEDLTCDEHGVVLPFLRIVFTPEQRKTLRGLPIMRMKSLGYEAAEGAARSDPPRPDPPPEKE